MAGRVNAIENRELWELTVRQPLPKRGERAADRSRATAAVTVVEAEYGVTAGALAAEVAGLLAEAAGAEQRAQLLDTQLSRMGAVLQSIEVRLAAGANARLSDRLTVQSRRAALQLATDQARRESEDALATARGQLGLSDEAPLPSFDAPTPLEISPKDSAFVALAEARAAEADASGKLARASANPATAVGVKFERVRGIMGNEDMVGLAFSSEIPFRTRRYARAEVRAAEADRAAAYAEGNAARHRVGSALSRVERAERVAITARQLAAETQARLHAEHDALSRAASVASMSGESAVLHAVDILDKTTETQLQIIDAETSARAARAELWRYVPASRWLAPPSMP